MGSYSCEILLNDDDEPTLKAIDSLLEFSAEEIKRTRKGRVWEIRVRGRHVHVDVHECIVGLCAGGKNNEDYEVLSELSHQIVATVGGIASEPET